MSKRRSFHGSSCRVRNIVVWCFLGIGSVVFNLWQSLHSSYLMVGPSELEPEYNQVARVAKPSKRHRRSSTTKQTIAENAGSPRVLRPRRPPTNNFLDPVQLFDKNATRKCFLDTSSRGLNRKLGSGDQGYAFETNLVCQPTNTKNARWTRESVVLKMKTIRTIPNNLSCPKLFISFDQSEIEEADLLYQRLGHETTQFAIPIGSVRVSANFQKHARNLINRRRTILVESPMKLVTGTIAPMVEGDELRSLLPTEDDTMPPKLELTLDRRQKVVQELVRLHRILWKHQVWHGDLIPRNVLVSDTQINIIDFDKRVLLDSMRAYNETFHHYARVKQAWELLNLIGNICGNLNFIPRVGFETRVWTQKGERKEKEIRKQALKKCNFERPMVWYKGSLQNETNRDQLYRALEHWVGLDPDPALVSS